MAPIDSESPHGSDDAIGCRVDRFSARKLRALDRQNRSEGIVPAKPTTQVGAAICGGGYSEQAQQRCDALRYGARPECTGISKQVYADMLSQQVSENRARRAHEVAERHERPPRVPREDSLDRLLVEGCTGNAAGRDAAGAGRARSQPPLGAPFAMQDNQDRAPTPQARRASPRGPFTMSDAESQPQSRPAGRMLSKQTNEGVAPWAMHNEQAQLPTSQQKRQDAPWAMDDNQPPPEYKPQLNRKQNGGGGAPFAMHEEQWQAGGMLVPGLPGRSVLPPKPPPQAATPADKKPPQRVISSNHFACGANQNCGNVITDRATSRVLRPPGGGSSLQLGW